MVNTKPAFLSLMKAVEEKYSPLLKKNENEEYYRIASSVSVLYESKASGYDKYFEINYDDNTISFWVHKRFFMGDSKESFSEQETIIKNLTNTVSKKYYFVEDVWKPISEGFKLTFKEKLTSENASKVVEMIDFITLLYIAENKKK